MKTSSRALCLFLAFLLTCVLPGGALGEAAPADGTIVSALANPDGSGFLPYNAVWGAPLNDIIATLPNPGAYQKDSPDFDKYLFSEMPNGHISILNPSETAFAGSDLPFTATYVFSEDGLYACNLRSILKNQSADEIQKALTQLAEILCQRLGDADFRGEPILTDAFASDVDNLKIDHSWTSESGTFLSFQVVSFMGQVIVDVNSGLISHFTNRFPNE